MAVKVIDGDSYTTVHDADANGTAENDVRSGSTKLYWIHVKNLDEPSGGGGATATVVYLKVFDNITPTEGTTEPDFVFPIAANSVQSFPFLPGTGITFANLSFLITQTKDNSIAQVDPVANTVVAVTLETDV